MSDDKRPILGISIGDPGGIGPEITAKALNEKKIHEIARPIVVGDYRVMEDVLKFTGLKLTLNKIQQVSDARGNHGVIDVLDLQNMPPDDLRYKTVTAGQGTETMGIDRIRIGCFPVRRAFFLQKSAG